MTTQNMIELRHIHHFFTLDSGRRVRVLEDVNLEVREGEVLVLLGPSGSGKSTCLRIMAGLIPPTSGEVLLQGHPLTGVNASLALVFQNFALLPWLSVMDNIALGIARQALAPEEAERRILRAIDLVGLEGFEEAYPKELSGGMKQRVGIARALVMNRPVLALDEPFSALDVLTAESLRKEVLNVWRSGETHTRAMVLVTHNIAEAVSMGGRIIVMGTSPGHIRYEIENKLAYPRSENSEEVRSLVEELHDILTESILPDVPQIKVGPPSPRLMEAIPPVSLMEVTGLLEAVASEGGEVNALTLSQKMIRDAVHILLITHAAEMLQFVDTPKNIIILTQIGRDFVHGDINQRKKLVHDQMMALPICKIVYEELKKKSRGSATKMDLEQTIHDHLPHETPSVVLHTLIQWGRFGELFGYSDDRREVYIDRG